MAARRNLPAAVLREGDPGAEGAARVIPAAAAVMKVGSAVVGYTVSASKARQNLTPAQLQATTRIRAVAQLLRWRADAGEAPTMGAVEAALDVLADAARFIPSGRHSLANVREHFPAEWRAAASDSHVLRAIEMPRDPRAGIMGNREAGRTLNLYLVEVLALEDESDGKPFPLIAIDETEQARALRRAKRRRQMEAARKRRARAAKRDHEPCNAVRISSSKKGNADADCKVQPQAERVRAAIEAGAATVAAIVRMVGVPTTSAYPILTRLMAAGVIVRTGRGTYATAVPLAQRDGEERDAAASATNSGQMITPEPHEPPSQFARDTPALALAADIGRAPDARGTACGAGPDAGFRLVPATALTPRRAAFSRLPGALSLHINRSTAHAAPPARCP